MARPVVFASGTRRIRPARRVLGLAPLLCSLLAFRAVAQPAPEAAFLPLWHTLPDRAGWQIAVSPAFPRTWPPPPGRGAVVRYAYAMRLNPDVADGAEMAAPWASVTLEAGRAPRVEQLAPRLRPLGLQGVRPLGGDEIALAGREPEVAAGLLAGGARATDRLVRDFTCGWIGRQGVVAAAIAPRHPAFMRWLACAAAAR